MVLYVLKDNLNHYYSRRNDNLRRSSALTTRHFQEAKFFIHDRVKIAGFRLVKVTIEETCLP